MWADFIVLLNLSAPWEQGSQDGKDKVPRYAIHECRPSREVIIQFAAPGQIGQPTWHRPCMLTTLETVKLIQNWG